VKYSKRKTIRVPGLAPKVAADEIFDQMRMQVGGSVVNVGVSVDGVLPIGARTRRTHGENILRLSVEGDENSCVCTEVNPRTLSPQNLRNVSRPSME
jgi:hypothetical protein